MSYRLPNGTVVTDPDKYIAAWRRLAEPLAKCLGGRASAYDPDIQITLGDGRVTTVDLVVAEGVAELMADRDRLRTAIEGELNSHVELFIAAGEDKVLRSYAMGYKDAVASVAEAAGTDPEKL
jgi:hypothetical protein